MLQRVGEERSWPLCAETLLLYLRKDGVQPGEGSGENSPHLCITVQARVTLHLNLQGSLG